MKLQPYDILIIDPENKHHEFMVVRMDKYGKVRTKENGLWFEVQGRFDLDKLADRFGFMLIKGKNK